MSDAAVDALRLTLLVASVATIVVWVPGTLIAYCLARKEFFGKRVLATLLLLPMVLPPTAIGYLLLRLFASDGLLGEDLLGFDPEILLTWKAAVIASAVMATPLVVRTATVTFQGIDPRLEMMARTLGHGRVRTFFGTTLPLASRGLLAAAILGFTRAVGEFGATVTIAGNIPGKTQTLSSAIYSAQQAGRDSEAYFFLVVALIVGFIAIFASEHLARHAPGKEPKR